MEMSPSSHEIRFRDPYNRKEIEAVLSRFLDQEIKAVHFVDADKLEHNYVPISSSDVQEAFLYGAEIEMRSGETLRISNKRYYSNYRGGTEGIDLAAKPFYQPSNSTINHFQTEPWKKYRDETITNFRLYELTHKIRAKFPTPMSEITVPYGFSLEFSNGSELFVLFIGLNDYSSEEKRHSDAYFCEDIHFIFNKEFSEKRGLHQSVEGDWILYEEL